MVLILRMSADVIHATAVSEANVYQDFLELEALYAEAAKDVCSGNNRRKAGTFLQKACCLEMKKVPDGIRTTLCLGLVGKVEIRKY